MESLREIICVAVLPRATALWLSPGTLISYINNTDHNNYNRNIVENGVKQGISFIPAHGDVYMTQTDVVTFKFAISNLCKVRSSLLQLIPPIKIMAKINNWNIVENSIKVVPNTTGR